MTAYGYKGKPRTCLYCGRALTDTLGTTWELSPATYRRLGGVRIVGPYFCSAQCMQRFALAAAQAGYRLPVV